MSEKKRIYDELAARVRSGKIPKGTPEYDEALGLLGDMARDLGQGADENPPENDNDPEDDVPAAPRDPMRDPIRQYPRGRTGDRPPNAAMTFAQHAGQSALGGFGDEAMSGIAAKMTEDFQPEGTPLGRALGFGDPEGVKREYAPGQGPETPETAAARVRGDLEAGARANPKSAVGGDVAGSAARWAALSRLVPGGLGRLLRSPEITAGTMATGAGAGLAEAALQGAGNAPTGQRMQGAVEATKDAAQNPLTYLGPAAGALAGKGIGRVAKALGATPHVAVDEPGVTIAGKEADDPAVLRWADARLRALGVTPTNIAKTRADKGDGYVAFVRQLDEAGFHKKRVGGVEVPVPSSKSAMRTKARAMRQQGERGLDEVTDVAEGRGATVNTQGYIDDLQGAADRVREGAAKGSGIGRQAHERWQKEADDTLAWNTAPGDIAPKPMPMRSAIESYRAEASGAYDAKGQKSSIQAAEHNARRGMLRERVGKEMPADLQEAFERANKDYELGHVGEEASTLGTLRSAADPRQAFRDATRATASAQNTEERAALSAVQQAGDWILSNFANDVNARRLAESVRHRVLLGQGTALEQELVRRLFTVAQPVTSGLSTGDSLRREIARQKEARNQ